MLKLRKKHHLSFADDIKGHAVCIRSNSTVFLTVF